MMTAGWGYPQGQRSARLRVPPPALLHLSCYTPITTRQPCQGVLEKLAVLAVHESIRFGAVHVLGVGRAGRQLSLAALLSLPS